MTPDGSAVELAAPDRAGAAARPLDVPEVIAICDRIVGEPGRREHRFAWLRSPEAASDGWLVVDAYYPASRLVVVCHDATLQEDRLFRELIPGRGLRLLDVPVTELPSDRPAAEAALRELLAQTGLAPRARETLTPEQPPEPAVAPRAAAASVPYGIVVGLALFAVVLFELYLGVVRFGLEQGHLALAFGLALDVGARATGTVAAVRAGEQQWPWWCAIGGSPWVAAFTLLRPGGPVKVEPAPLAGLVAIMAMLVVITSLALRAVGV